MRSHKAALSSPSKRRSFNSALLRNTLLGPPGPGDSMKHSFSTLDLQFDSDTEDGPATFSAGYNLHYEGQGSPGESRGNTLYRVVSVEYQRQFNSTE